MLNALRNYFYELYKQKYFTNTCPYSILGIVRFCVTFYFFGILLGSKPISPVFIDFGSDCLFEQSHIVAVFCKKEDVHTIHICICYNFIFSHPIVL